VSTAIDSLPDDIEGLRAFALKALAERDAALADRDRLQSLYERVHHQLRQAIDHRFGAKSEKLARLPADQLQLALEDIEVAMAAHEALEEKKQPSLPRTRRGAERRSLPKHLPRVHETIAPKETVCPCCKAPMHAIGEETSERLDVVPAQYRVIVTHRPKLACRACEKIVQSPAPEHLIKSGLPTEAMVASVLVAKYGWHLPLYRQEKMLSCQGIEIDRSTLAFWVGYAAEAARHLLRHRAVRRLRAVQETSGRPHRHRVLLGAPAPAVLQACERRQRADRDASPASYLPTLQNRRQDQEQKPARTKGCAPGGVDSARDRLQSVPRKRARPRLQKISHRRSHPLRPQSLGWTDALPR
jgi:transposase